MQLRRLRMGRRGWLTLLVGVAGLVVGSWTSIPARNDRDWIEEQSRMPVVHHEGDLVTIGNVRNFDPCADDSTAAGRWEERSYDLQDLDSLWFVLSPFGRDWRGPAHPFLTFGFGDTSFVGISVEARKEKGESYSIWRGLLKRYEMMYVVADERDLVGLRVRCFRDDVYVYPIRTSPERTRGLFLDMLARAEALGERPEFYHTVWNNCTTNVVDHANRVSVKPIPGGLRVLLPGYTDAIAYSLDLIDDDGDLEEVRRRHLVNERAERALSLPPARFSAAIRADAP